MITVVSGYIGLFRSKVILPHSLLADLHTNKSRRIVDGRTWDQSPSLRKFSVKESKSENELTSSEQPVVTYSTILKASSSSGSYSPFRETLNGFNNGSLYV